MRLKSTPTGFMGENNSALEARGDGLAPGLAEVHRTVERDSGVVAHGDVECESRLLPARETPHRGFEQRPSEAAPATALRAAELGDERHAHPVRDHNFAHDPAAPFVTSEHVRPQPPQVAFA